MARCWERGADSGSSRPKNPAIDRWLGASGRPQGANRGKLCGNAPPAYAPLARLGNPAPRRFHVTPIRLTDSELDAVFAAAAPIDQHRRDAFLQAASLAKAWCI